MSIAAAGLVAGLALGTALLGRIEPVTTAVTLGMAGLCAAGAVAMAWIMAPRSACPRWAWYATAAVMAAALIASVFIAPSAAAWDDDMRPMAWMLPWFIVVMRISQPRREADCPVSGARAGWTMVATGLVLSVLLLGAAAIVDGAGSFLL